jgi:protein-S-isoprenylcysteine O-methyltransferase Ste14
MPMIEEMEAAGKWLFRRRSGLPLLLLVLFFAGLANFAYPFGSHPWDQFWEVLCLVVSLSGLATRVMTVGFAPCRTSGRNRKEQVADELNTTGMYSVVRNPLYFGNFLVGLGMSLFLREWWPPITYALLFILYYERIVFAEEVFLREKFGQAYLDWAADTPAFVPRLGRWKPPALPFNGKKVLRSEHQTLLVIVCTLYCFEFLEDYRVNGRIETDWMWNGILACTLIIFTAIRILHKCTSVLKDRRT